MRQRIIDILRNTDFLLEDGPDDAADEITRLIHVEYEPPDCEQCLEDGEHPHSCPLRADLHDDPDSLCSCCIDCIDECRGDV